MNDRDRQFYKELFPCLNDGRWMETGADAFGLVRWQIRFGFDAECGEVSARVGLIVYPTSAKLFVSVTTHQSDKTYIQDLICKPETASMAVIEEEVGRVAASLIMSNLKDIQAAQAEWQQEIEDLYHAR